MNKKRRKIRGLSTVFKLNYASVDEAADKVQAFLTSLKIEKDSVLRIRLSVEEALLRWIDHYQEETEFRLEMGLHWNRPFITLKLWGDDFDPLTESGNEIGLWVGDLLGAIGLAPVYRYINGCNVIQISLRRPKTNPGVTLLLFTLVGTIVGIAVDLIFSAEVLSLITSTVLMPLQDAFIRVLNAVSAPVLFLSILTTVCGVGSISVSGKGGARLVSRFLLYSTMFTIVTLFLCERFFVIRIGSSVLSNREISGVLDFFLDIIPGDILSPFIAGDFTQIIVVALVLGNALLIAGAKVQTLVNILDEANTAGLLIAEWVGDASPGFVALLIILGIQNDTIHLLVGLWKPALLITVFSALALLLRMLHITLRYKVSLTKLWNKLQPSFLLSLKTFSVETSFTANLKCCEKDLGISKQLSSYGLPIGLICFMPVNTVASTILTLYCAECYDVPVSIVWMIMALFLAVTLAAAGPPMAGIGILTYTVMFSKLGIPSQALTIVLMGDILMGFVMYPINQAMLQLELVLIADRARLLNKAALRR